MFEHLSMFADPFTLVGAVNIHLDHASNLTTKFNNLLATYGLIQHVTSARMMLTDLPTISHRRP